MKPAPLRALLNWSVFTSALSSSSGNLALTGQPIDSRLGQISIIPDLGWDTPADGGERLTSVDIASFFILLSAAGNETTRNAISHGMVALTRYPEEREKWWANFDGLAATAVEEIVRWACPVIYMRRTLTQDVEMRGIEMNAGAKVSMWYNSGNRDEAKFDRPWHFDVARDPNPQMGFGGGGAHFCLGANLARREIRVLFEELHRQIPDIVAVEQPSLLHSAFLHGIKRLPVAWTPPS